MIKVSVIVPIYNVKNYLNRQIESIKAQTMSDWELILVDDASTDDVRELLEDYASKDSRIRYVCHQKNAGVAAARYTGLKESCGEYVCFFDGDDWVDSNTLEETFALAKQKDADIVCFSYHKESVGKDSIYHFKQKGICKFSGEHALNELHTRRNIQPHAWNKLYKRQLFEERMFTKDKLLGEDYGMIVDLLEKSSVIVQTDMPYYHYILRKGSTLDNGFGDFYKNGFYFYERYEDTLISKYPQYQNNIRRYHLIEQMAIVVSMFKNDVYDHEIRKRVTANVRRNLHLLIFNADVERKYKVAAIALCIHYKILKYGYRFVYDRTRKQRKETNEII